MERTGKPAGRIPLERLSTALERQALPDARTRAGALLEVLARVTGKAVERYGLIEQGDRLLVALSGGKDSWSALYALAALRARAPIRFSLSAVHVHGGVSRPAYEEALRRMGHRLSQLGVEGLVARTDVVSRARRMGREGQSACFLCARFRRGVLYRLAVQEGFTKIVLGHHADDLIETLLLNLFFTGQIKSMPPKLRTDDGANVVIRPLCLAWEEQTRAFAEAANLPIVPSPCGEREPDTRRTWVKGLLERIQAEHPEVKHYLRAALGHVRPSHLMDDGLWDFRARPPRGPDRDQEA